MNNNDANTPPLQNWERQTLEKLLLASVKEQRRHRRWSIFFKLLFFIFLFAMLWLLWPKDSTLPPPNKQKPHIALINITGEISDTNQASATNVTTGLQNAFKNKNTVAVILHINSPGGSPVQAADIYDEIHYQQQRHPKIKVYAVCSDVCASAAYYIAAASNEIYANQGSLVGSIGVMLNGFGFVDTMQKMGVERRLLISGANKSFLDPFSPLKPNEKQYAQNLLDNVHAQFIHSVEQGRGDRLKQNPNIFSGLVWSGNQALPLGLIDGFGSVNSVARDVIKNNNIIDYTVKPGLLEQLTDRVSASFSHEIAGQLGLRPGALQ